MASQVNWLAPWYGVNNEAERRGLEAELLQEIGDAHALAGKSVTLLARRGDMDDALYLLHDGRVAEVNLTWARQREANPSWPDTAIYASLEDWANRSMLPTHASFADDD